MNPQDQPTTENPTPVQEPSASVAPEQFGQAAPVEQNVSDATTTMDTINTIESEPAPSDVVSTTSPAQAFSAVEQPTQEVSASYQAETSAPGVESALVDAPTTEATVTAGTSETSETSSPATPVAPTETTGAATVASDTPAAPATPALVKSADKKTLVLISVIGVVVIVVAAVAAFILASL